MTPHLLAHEDLAVLEGDRVIAPSGALDPRRTSIILRRGDSTIPVEYHLTSFLKKRRVLRSCSRRWSWTALRPSWSFSAIRRRHRASLVSCFSQNSSSLRSLSRLPCR